MRFLHRYSRLRPGSVPARRRLGAAVFVAATLGPAFVGAAPPSADLPPLGGGADAAVLSGGSARLPALGEAQAWSLGREQRLGDSLLASLYQEQAVLEDAVFHDYLMAVWAPLFDSAKRQGMLTPAVAERFRWRLLTIRDASVNAFAMPGGVVGVHLGLMAATDTPAQLGAVLAHELSHVAQRHLARLLERQNQVAPLAMGAAVLAILAASSGASSGDAAQAVFAGSQAALLQSGINFTRDMEREADRIGQLVFDGAGYPSAEFGAMFNKLYEASRLNDDGSFPYLRTHPLSHERLAEVMAREHGRPAGARTGPVPLAWGQWMRARAQVMQTTRREDWQDWLRSTPDAAATPPWMAYRAALAAVQLGERQVAWSRLNHLAQSSTTPDVLQAVLRADMLALWLTPGALLAPEAQIQAWAQTGLTSQTRAVWLTAAEAAVRWPSLHAAAAAKLQPWLAAQPQDAQAWGVLARLREAQSQPLRALRAQAEAQVARGNLDGALDRLRAAQDWSRAHPQDDPVEAQVIWARERSLREQQRALAEAEREDK